MNFTATGFWRFVDKIGPFRVISPDEFEASDRARVVWLGIGAAFWLTGACCSAQVLRW